MTAAGPVPLVPAQQEILRAYDELTPGGDEPLDFCLHRFLEAAPVLDRRALTAAIVALTGRHAALRSRFSKRTGEWSLTISDSADTPIEFSSFDAPFAECAQEVLNVFCPVLERWNIESGPLVRVAVAETQDRVIVMGAVHHLATDLISQEIWVRELTTAYALAASGNQLSLPPVPVTFTDHARRVDLIARQPSGTMDDASVRECVDAPGNARIPWSRSPSDRYGAGGPKNPCRLELTGRIRELAGELELPAAEIVLTALLSALAEWVGDPVGVSLTHHGRYGGLLRGTDLSGTIGPLFYRIPVLAESCPELPARERISRARSARSSRAGAALRAHRGPSRRPPVLVNYRIESLGPPSVTGSPGLWWTSPFARPQAAYLFESPSSHQMYELDGGQMRFMALLYGLYIMFEDAPGHDIVATFDPLAHLRADARGRLIELFHAHLGALCAVTR